MKHLSLLRCMRNSTDITRRLRAVCLFPSDAMYAKNARKYAMNAGDAVAKMRG